MEIWINKILSQSGFDPSQLQWLNYVIQAGGIFLLAVVINLITRRFFIRGIDYLAQKTETTWDDVLVKKGVFNRLGNIAPAAVFYIFSSGFGPFEIWVEKFALIAMVITTVRMLDELLDSLVDIYQVTDIAREKPIRGYSQVAKILAYMVAGIFVISILLNKEPWSLLTGLGAMSAILLLVFKDSILGFIAAVQIASYNMIRRGDWVEMSKYDSDGEVLDISLHTVKVQNWDKTISTIPTQAFINESFKNWRGMEESGGRRIKRAISIDMDSIRFCDDALLEKFSKSEVIGDYIKGKRQEVSAYNAEKGYDPRETINGRRLTNIGTFRAYVEAYLRRHKEINMNMTFMVRQLAPSDKGLPIEIYVFCRDQRWAYYEAIQADIFDHLLSVLPEFDLWVFQSPSARSVLNLGGAVKNT